MWVRRYCESFQITFFRLKFSKGIKVSFFPISEGAIWHIWHLWDIEQSKSLKFFETVWKKTDQTFNIYQYFPHSPSNFVYTAKFWGQQVFQPMIKRNIASEELRNKLLQFGTFQFCIQSRIVFSKDAHWQHDYENCCTVCAPIFIILLSVSVLAQMFPINGIQGLIVLSTL